MIAIVVALIVAAAALLLWRSIPTPEISTVTGAVLARDPDPHKQRPIPNAIVIAGAGGRNAKAVSDGKGLFRLRLEPPVPAGEQISLRVEHPDYRPFTTGTAAGDEIQLLRLTPKAPAPVPPPAQKQVAIANIRVRYATKATNTVNVGSVVRTFDILNRGNVPCEGQPPCSPDGKWKAMLGSLSINTGEDNKYFRNARVSCIAGPCPFTSIESDGFSRGGRAISVVVRNWSDRVTYVLEAEVEQTIQTDLIRHTYPVMFGRSLNFTLPAQAKGPSIEAEVDGAEIAFPLGPELRLSWAACRLELQPDGTQVYRCELKPGFRFG
ncbi:MAG TPA: carboxypeptidase-like regulatory domain-containing protein [Bryobacteraceae bacterium]|nr:carboxypeptidase-like regulatory domain-containing protein [Bryobacteraceae bacterium]